MRNIQDPHGHQEWPGNPLCRPWSSGVGWWETGTPASPPASQTHCCWAVNELLQQLRWETPSLIRWTPPRSAGHSTDAMVTQRQLVNTIQVQQLTTEGPLPANGQDSNTLVLITVSTPGEHIITWLWGWQLSPHGSGLPPCGKED